MPEPEKTISHEAERRRYELRLDGQVVGIADYVEEGRVRSFTHTAVEPRHRGQGLAAELVDFALREAREGDVQVLPSCWYVRDHIAQHPEYLELVPGDRRRSFGLKDF
jgi:predicted GNAT family acetyltransferase